MSKQKLWRIKQGYDGIHKEYEQPEKAENGSGDAEDAAGETDNEHKKP